MFGAFIRTHMPAAPPTLLIGRGPAGGAVTDTKASLWPFHTHLCPAVNQQLFSPSAATLMSPFSLGLCFGLSAHEWRCF